MSGLSNYPPGVSGNEPQIVGYPPCGNCGHDEDAHDEDGRCLEPDCACRDYDRWGAEAEAPEDFGTER